MNTPVGIIAGNGTLPIELAERLTQAGTAVSIFGIQGEADPVLHKYDYADVEWEKVGRLFAMLEARGIKRLTMAGGVVGRPQLRLTRLDWGGIRTLPGVLSALLAGDNEILSTVMSVFEKRGLTVCGAAELVPELLVEEGVLTKVKPKANDRARLAEGVKVTTALGPFDVGQACVVLGKRAVAVEGVEGTDAMLERVAHMRSIGRLPTTPSGVLVKIAKPGQDLRADLPTIGQGTVKTAKAAGLVGIGIAAGCSIILRREETVEAANKAGLFIAGIPTDG
ncbi:MAG: UDP-2,3-diacylglucosamine diphosphatase LpxI [Pseudomonadota bacterium]